MDAAKGFTLTHSRTVQLTRALAEEMHTMKPSPTERPLEAKRVEFLRSRVEAGILAPFDWAKVRLNDEWYRMNGQHSSEMLCKLPDELFPLKAWVHYDEYEVPNLEAMTALFQVFDARPSTRSRADVAGAYKGLHEELRDIPRDIAILGVQGVTYYRRRVEKIPVQTGTDIFEAFGDRDVWPFLNWLPELFTAKTPELRVTQIVAAIYGTFDKSAEQARDFWKLVSAGGVNSEADNPTTTLDEYYLAYHNETDSKKSPPTHQLYQAGIQAWNAYRAGQKLVRIRLRENGPNPEISA